MNYEIIESKDYVKDYYKLLTGGSLSKRQYDVLASIASSPAPLDEKRRIEISASLSISSFNLNNIIAALKKKELLVRGDDNKYKLWKNPPEGDSITLQLKRA